jgi:hypothetical protein
MRPKIVRTPEDYPRELNSNYRRALALSDNIALAIATGLLIGLPLVWLAWAYLKF